MTLPGAVVRVHLSFASVADRRGAGEEAPSDFSAYSTRLQVGRAELLDAAPAWEQG